jgi:hypothetical protein
VTAPALARPPSAPGSLTAPAGARSVLLYLEELRTWRDSLGASLSSMDRRAQAASTPDEFTADLTLAMSLSESIDRRTDELVRTWDSGRVTETELAEIAQLTWGRLPDPLGSPTAFSLNEATTLAAALEARLAARLDADMIAGSGAAEHIAPLRETLTRCRALSETLGRHGGEADELAAALETALNTTMGPAELGAEVNRIADAAEILERDLIKETALRASVERDAAKLAERLVELGGTADEVAALADRCRDKIADPPRIAVPDVTVLGSVPPIPSGSGEPGTWTAARGELDAYESRLDRVGAALAEAGRRYGKPLTERAELRGLADAYRAKVGAAGLSEDPALDASYDAVRMVLWSAPCDLAAARLLVAEYRLAAQFAVRGVDADEPQGLEALEPPPDWSVESEEVSNG